MRTDGKTMRGHELATPHLDLQRVKAWAKSTFAKERIIDFVVCTSTATVLGMVLFTLYKATENRTVVGF